MSSILNGRGAADILAASLDQSPVAVVLADAGTVVLAAAVAGQTPVLLGISIRAYVDASVVKIQGTSTVFHQVTLDKGQELILSPDRLQMIRGIEGEALNLVLTGSTPGVYGSAWVANDIRS